jgi:hypothetical protein
MQGDLSALIERVENATGPDRELDCLIDCFRHNRKFLGWTADTGIVGYRYEHPTIGADLGCWRIGYTSSLDAALALVEEILPGWTRLVDATAPELGICVELFPSDDIAERTESARGDHNRETHATLLALLRALSNGSKEGVA